MARRTQEERRDLVRRWEASGVSQKAFCRQEGICEDVLRKARKRYAAARYRGTPEERAAIVAEWNRRWLAAKPNIGVYTFCSLRCITLDQLETWFKELGVAILCPSCRGPHTWDSKKNGPFSTRGCRSCKRRSAACACGRAKCRPAATCLWCRLAAREKRERILDKDGYVLAPAPDHPRARRGRVLEHILVMEEALGRRLRKGEQVHHKNAIRHDNRRQNLELWSGDHPCGARVEDLVRFAKEVLARYDGVSGALQGEDPYVPPPPKVSISKGRRQYQAFVVGDIAYTVADWGRVTGIPPSTLHNRIRAGWKPEDVVSVPPQRPIELAHLSVTNRRNVVY